MPIPAKSYAAHAAHKDVEPWDFERRDPKPNDVVIDIKFCGICHTDVSHINEYWRPSIFPMVPGHEIAGIVRAVGSNVTKFKVGDRAGVGCAIDSCGKCDNCQTERENYCMEYPTVTYNSRDRTTGEPNYGGYSDVIVAKEDFVLAIPDSVPLEEAAPLLCAGTTLYSALTHFKATPGSHVAIVGLGGIGHVGVKLAKALGTEVTVISQTDRKKADALKMGATNFLATSDPKMFEQNQTKFDLILNTVSSAFDVNKFLGLLKTDGTLVCLSVPNSTSEINLVLLVRHRRSLTGSAFGSVAESQKMLDFCAEHKVSPDIEIIAPSQINEAFKRLEAGDVRYRFVIDMTKL